MSGGSLGKDQKTYINTGTNASPTWVLIDKIVDGGFSFGKNEATSKTRESDWEKSKGASKQLSASFTYEKEKGDTDTTFDLLWASYKNGTVNEYAFLDDLVATSGAHGFRAAFEVMSLQESEEFDDFVSYDVEIKHADLVESGSIIEPDEMTVA